jgi:hypothetical protein
MTAVNPNFRSSEGGRSASCRNMRGIWFAARVYSAPSRTHARPRAATNSLQSKFIMLLSYIRPKALSTLRTPMPVH